MVLRCSGAAGAKNPLRCEASSAGASSALWWGVRPMGPDRTGTSAAYDCLVTVRMARQRLCTV